MKVAPQVHASNENRVVVGLGATGLSCARYLYAQNLPFCVIDSRKQPPGLDELQREMPEVQVYAGDYPTEIVAHASELVVSPGVAMSEPIIREALTAGVTVVGDIDLFMRAATAPVVGITGSNAKSTVTELLGKMAGAAQLNVGVGGNLGTPALELLADHCELYVLELSSFQLERAAALHLQVATVLNVSPDHLDRHGDLAGYRQVKHRIFRGCGNVVVNRGDPNTLPVLDVDLPVVGWCMREPESGDFGLREHDGVEYLCRGDQQLLRVQDLGLKGRHNVANALAALALGYSVGLPLAAMTTTLQTFKGLPHRCELVAQHEGVRYVNDSKGTNVGSVEAALRGLGGERDIILIAGGQGKGADFSQLQQAVTQHCKALVLIGEDASLLQQVLHASAPVTLASSMEEAVTIAVAAASFGDTVLLSPACASFDMFTGYVHRGEAFRNAVEQLSQEGE